METPGCTERALWRKGRRGARAAFHGWVELAVAGERLLATACDLSEAASASTSRAPHPTPGAHVETEFALPGFDVPLAVSARVAWSDTAAGRLGLQFEPLDVAVAELLAEHRRRPVPRRLTSAAVRVVDLDRDMRDVIPTGDHARQRAICSRA